MASHIGLDSLNDHHHESFTTNYPHSLRTRGTSPYATNRTTTLSSNPTLQRRPPIPEEFRMPPPDPQGEIIDTAIVIKNIPFSYPEEDFLSKLFPDLGLVPPYAFNYHRNKADGAFHGLAFANFNTPRDAQNAVDVLNNYELDRRKLRVELKKRLPAEEEQRQRLVRQTRRQTTQPTPLPSEPEQSRPSVQEVLTTTLSGAVISLPMASDVLDPQYWPHIVYHEPSTPAPQGELNMNDPDVLAFYTTVQIFRNQKNTAGASLQFPPALSPHQRRIIHGIAKKLNLESSSHGIGSERYVRVSRQLTPTPEPSPRFLAELPDPLPQPFRPLPITRASNEQLSLISPTSVRSPLPPSPRLRSVASMGNLRSPRSPTSRPPVPSLPYEMFPPVTYDPYPHHLGHRSSHDSVVLSRTPMSYMGGIFHSTSMQPMRQPIGPPQDLTRGFSERGSREGFNQVRPIGHGAKTSSHGSLSHASVASTRESKGGSDPILDL